MLLVPTIPSTSLQWSKIRFKINRLNFNLADCLFFPWPVTCCRHRYQIHLSRDPKLEFMMSGWSFKLADCLQHYFALASWPIDTKYISLEIQNKIYESRLNFRLADCLFSPRPVTYCWYRFQLHLYLDPSRSFIRLAAGFDVEGVCLRIKFYTRAPNVWVCVHSHNHMCHQIPCLLLSLFKCDFTFHLHAVGLVSSDNLYWTLIVKCEN